MIQRNYITSLPRPLRRSRRTNMLSIFINCENVQVHVCTLCSLPKEVGSIYIPSHALGLQQHCVPRCDEELLEEEVDLSGHQ